MKKNTKAFQLSAITVPVTIVLDPNENIWYPINPLYEPYKKNELFIYGKGPVKIGRWKKEIIEPMTEPITASQIKIIADRWGVRVAQGMIDGGSNTSLFADRSCYQLYPRLEVVVMAHMGQAYDDLTDKVQVIGDEFIEALLNNGFKLEGTIEKGCLSTHSLINEEYQCVGFMDRFKIHPLHHLETAHKFGFGAMLPSFNSLSFDEVMVKLILSRYSDKDCKSGCKKLDEVVSVRDRIALLTTEDIADKIGSIFELIT